MDKEKSGSREPLKTRVTRAGVAVLGIGSLALASCGPATATETASPTGETDATKTLTVEPPTQTKTFEPTPTDTPTVTETPTPVPVWQTTMETQDPQGQFFVIVDNQPTIDRYDTPATESIVLEKETIKMVETNDTLNPSILTAKDAEGVEYAFNPEHGWFGLPEVQMDYEKLGQYTEVDQAFVEDGRANITTALLYAENPTISPDAIDPVYWVSSYWMDKTSYDRVPMLCNNMCGLRIGNGDLYPEEIGQMFYDETNKPFAWTGFYKVQLENGESIYVLSRTLKNPTDTDPNQTINLFYGFDMKTWEGWANNMLPSNRTELTMIMSGTDKGGCDLAVILPPPVSLDGATVPFRLSPNDWITGGNPTVAGLQERGGLISELDPVNLQIMMSVLKAKGERRSAVAPLTQPLPGEFSTQILLSAFVNR
jgi:hypothetical protein